MPGIASDRPTGIQISPIASIGTEIQPTPAIGDLMDAFKQGFITVDDLQRRNVQNISTNDQLKTQLQASDFQRKLAPGAFANAQAAQGLQASQIQAAGQILPGATELTLGGQEAALQEQEREARRNSDLTEEQLAQDADDTKRLYVRTFGEDPSKSIKIDAPLPVDNFDTWLEKTHGKELVKEINDFDPGVPDPKDHDQIILDKINTFQSGFPLNSKEDNIARAKFANALEIDVKSTPTPDELRAQFENQARAQLRDDPAVRTEYENYKTAQAKNQEALKIGTAEHTEVMKQRIQVAQDNAALRAAKLSAAPDIFKTQATAPGKAAEEARKNVQVLQKDYSIRQEIQDLRKVQAAFYKIERLLDPSVPPSAPRDQGAVFSWMKILDPGSTVREGEYATAKNARGVPDKISAWYNQVLTGQILTPEQRIAFKEAVEPVYLGQVEAAAPTIKQFLAQEGSAIGEVVPREDAALLKRVSPAASTPPPAGSAAPPNGAKRVVQNGVTFEWNGSKYAALP